MREIGPDVYQVPLFTRFWESVHFTQKNEQKLLLWEGFNPFSREGFCKKGLLVIELSKRTQCIPSIVIYEVLGKCAFYGGKTGKIHSIWRSWKLADPDPVCSWSLSFRLYCCVVGFCALLQQGSFILCLYCFGHSVFCLFRCAISRSASPNKGMYDISTFNNVPWPFTECEKCFSMF